VFSEKRLQAIENKRNECKKEGKETTKRRQVLENSRLEAGCWKEEKEQNGNSGLAKKYLPLRAKECASC
jgi:hypothetical protein